ncbi:MAG: DUF669 domain-containing protein [Hyphomicrobiaceae bacterium]|nr:MAG: DUF669 domain-containing protein [Hyphomicrobiaceae bacterium]
MGNLGFFDSSAIEPSAPLEAMPGGVYVMAVTKSDVKPNKKGTGKFIEFVWSVVEDGPFKGRKVWQRVNFQHSNSTTQAIGQGELSAISRACGVNGLTDTSQLHNIPVKVKVGVEKYEGKDKNVVEEVLWKETAGTRSAPVASATSTLDTDEIPF